MPWFTLRFLSLSVFSFLPLLPHYCSHLPSLTFYTRFYLPPIHSPACTHLPTRLARRFFPVPSSIGLGSRSSLLLLYGSRATCLLVLFVFARTYVRLMRTAYARMHTRALHGVPLAAATAARRACVLHPRLLCNM